MTASAQDTAESITLDADTPMTTVTGNPFIAPEGWTVTVRGPATILEAPEGGSRLALIDVEADDQDSALAAGWAAYGITDREMLVSNDSPDSDGWTRQRSYQYRTSPNERRGVGAGVMRGADGWTVWIYDMADDVGQKRGSQVSLVFDRLFPKGYEKESFAGRKANRLDAARLADIAKFVWDGIQETGVPGVSYGIVQGGKVVFSGGIGVRQIGKPEKVDGDTRYMIASNTKALTTLLLARLVDAGKISWTDPVTKIMPGFRLGDADTTARVLIEHLICACTGLPRQDFEWLLEYQDLTPKGAMATLATMQPTSEFGELFQYSNPMAAAAGYVAGSVLHPEHEMGAAYDMAMQEQVFDPLGMTSTTFDYDAALSSGNVAMAHAPNFDDQPSLAVFDIDYSVIPVRPAGGAWSSVNDMLKYVQMELDEGLLPDGERYISRDALLERRRPMVALGSDGAYGMGLMTDHTYDTQVVHHGGDMIGYHSDMIWLPEHDVGAVILTNGDPGWQIRSRFSRKLLEVLFDGKPEADEALAADARRYYEQRKAGRTLMTVPADGEAAGELAGNYINDALGPITVRASDGRLFFDFGEWQSEVASKNNPDGSLSFVTVSPGIEGLEFVLGEGGEKTLILRDAQHEYVFDAV
jgi:CubicO group peptidase (beta-lactamase class C family)